MQDRNTRIQELFTQWFNGTLADNDRLELEKLASEEGFNDELPELLRTQWETLKATDDFTIEDRRILGEAITDKYPAQSEEVYRTQAHRVHFLRKWGWAAASVILLIAAAVFLVVSSDRPDRPANTAATFAHTAEILPGKEGAILTLADGSQVVLDSLGNGVIASQNGAQAVLKDGELTYDPSGSASGEPAYNTMTTPKGRQFQVTLPDGTKVWLNAASSIRYPTVFAGSERKVTVTGEAYFEVAKNAKMPFRVNVNGKAEVEVLGTHFNVNAYENEETVSTTLLEGSIAVAVFSDRQQQSSSLNDREQVGQKTRPVMKTQSGMVLKPGQQARIAVAVPSDRQPPASPIKIINNADIGKVMAWKNGLFNFEGATLQEVMKQTERWYDIEVVYEKGIPNIEFEGKMTKDISLDGLLNALERSDVHFRIEGRKLIVLP